MAVGTGTALLIGAGLSAAGTGYGAYEQSQAAGRQRKRQDELYAEAARMRQSGPGRAEQGIMQLLQELGGQGSGPLNIAGTLDAGGYNAGQDALMQMLRSAGPTMVDKSLENTIGGQGNPFDTSNLFQALGVLDQENIGGALAQQRAGVSGLGQRFGSANRAAEVDLLRGITNDLNARNAQIQQGAYETAQARLMQANQLMTGREQFGSQNRLDTIGALQSGAMGLGDILMRAQAQQAAIQAQRNSLQANLLNALLGGEQARNNFNLQTLGLGAQLPAISTGYGSAAADLGGLLMFLPFLMQMQSGSGAKPSAGGK